MRISELMQLDAEMIKDMYKDANLVLRDSLLKGIPWEEVQECRYEMINLEIALFKKIKKDNLNPESFVNRPVSHSQ